MNQSSVNQASVNQSSADDIATLVRRLLETEQQLRALIAGDRPTDAQPSPVTDPAAAVNPAVHPAAHPAALACALLDADGVIVHASSAWRRQHARGGLFGTARETRVGANFLEVCDRAADGPSTPAYRLAAGIRSVLAGTITTFALDNPGSASTTARIDVFGLGSELRERVALTLIDEDEAAEVDTPGIDEARFRATFEQASVGIAHITPDGVLVEVNDCFCGLTGYSREELLRLRMADVMAPEDLDSVEAARLAMVAGAASTYSAEKRCRRKNAATLWVHLNTTLVLNAQGAPAYFITVIEDITLSKQAEFRLQRLNRLYSVLRGIGKAIVGATDRQSLYAAACRIAVETGGLSMVLVAEVDAAANRVLPVASFGAGLEYADAVDVRIDGALSLGTIGTAVRSGHFDVCNDIGNDPRMRPWRAEALRWGFSATASFPLSIGGVTIGALVLFANEVDYFHDDEIDLMVAIAEELSFALASIGASAQRSAAEERLRQSEALLRIAGQTARVGGWTFDIATQRLTLSDEVCAIRELPAGTVLPIESALQLYPPEWSPVITQAVQRCQHEGIPYDLELEIFTSSGKRVWVRTMGQPVRAANGDIVALQGAFQDISERKRSEAQTQQLAMRLSTTLESITDAFFTLDSEWCFTYVNRETQRLLQRSRSELLGANIWTVFPDFVGSIVDHQYRRAVGERCTVEFEYFYPPLDLWAEVRGYPSDAGLTVYFRDITERKQNAQRQHSAERTRAAILRVQQEINAPQPDLQETMNLVAHETAQLTGASGCAIKFVEADQLVCRAAAGALTQFTGSRPLKERSLSALALESGEVMVSDDADSDSRLDQLIVRTQDARALIAAPLRDGDRLIGVLKVVSDRPRAFTPADISSVQILAESLSALLQRHRAAEALRSSEAQYRLLFNSNPHPMWVYDIASLCFVAVNDAAVQHYGYSIDEFLAMNIRDIRAPAMVAQLERSLSTNKDQTRQLGIWQHRRKDGSFIDVEISSDRIVFDGRMARLVLAHDITERLSAERELNRLNRAQRLLSHCIAAQIRAEDEATLLDEICQIAVREGGYRMAWIGYARNDPGRSIEAVAHAGAETAYLSEIALSWSETAPAGQGPAGQAIRSGLASIATDISEASAQFHYYALAEQHGLRGVICLPLRDGPRTFGLLGLYTADVLPVGDEEVQLLQQLADDVAFGIDNLRSQRERHLLQNAVMKVAAGVSASVGNQFFEQLAHSMIEALAADAGYVIRLDAANPGLARTIMALEDGAMVANFDYPIDGTPCSALLQFGQCVVADQVAERYPGSPMLRDMAFQGYVGRRLDSSQGQAIGLLYVMYRRPLERPEFVASTLQIFAARAAAEMERLDTDERMREQASLLDKAQDAIVVHAIPDHRILYWNQGAERLYGWTTAQALGRPMDSLLKIASEQTLAPFQCVMDEGEWSGEFDERRMDGSPLLVEARCTLVRDRSGVPRSILSIMSDITERRHAEDRLQQALVDLNSRNRELQDFAFIASHDLQEPLRKIRTFSDRLISQSSANLDAQARDYLVRSGQAAERMQTLIDDLLEYSRIESRGRTFTLVELGPLLATVIEDLGARIESTSASIEIDPMPALEGDYTQLRQLFQNLIANALKFHHPQRKPLVQIRVHPVRIEQGRAAFKFTIQDNGIGFDPKYAERIFAPFQRLHSREHYEGTGIGLAIVRRIVERHRGGIQVSAVSGQGAIFTIVLPQRQREAVHEVA